MLEANSVKDLCMGAYASNINEKVPLLAELFGESEIVCDCDEIIS
jgi:hypothetical protein